MGTGFLQNAAWALSNMVRFKPTPALDVSVATLPILAKVLALQDEQTVADGLWALSYQTDDNTVDNRRIQAVIESMDDCTMLVDLCSHKSEDVRRPALRVVGNIATGSETQTQHVLDAGCLDKLRIFLQDKKEGYRKEACWALSNITAGTAVQIQSVLDGATLPVVYELITREDCKDGFRKEASYAVSNAISGGSEAQRCTLLE